MKPSIIISVWISTFAITLLTFVLSILPTSIVFLALFYIVSYFAFDYDVIQSVRSCVLFFCVSLFVVACFQVIKIHLSEKSSELDMGGFIQGSIIIWTILTILFLLILFF
jgi:1-acyl-sn-glycerol-3-phosphate acyltransferase